VFLFKRTVPNEFHLESLAVSETERGKGTGKKLLDATIEHARMKGFSRIRLEVVETNNGAKRLYEKFGFKEVNVQKVSFPFSKLLGFESVTEMVYTL
jgi:ribosomal protein S18 acetylase RimI-like enzyme